MKPALAIFTPGGIGGGIDGKGFPALVQIVHHLSHQWDVHVFTHAPVSTPFPTIQFHQAPVWLRFSTVRWFALIFLFLKARRRIRFNIIFSFWGYPSGWVAVRLSKLIGAKSLVYLLGGEVVNVPEVKYGLMRNSFTRRMVLWTCKHADVLLTLTNYQIKHLGANGCDREVFAIPFGTDRNLFKPIQSVPENVVRIIHVANINPVKDQVTLLKAFAKIRSKVKATLKIVGPDLMQGQIQQLAKELGVENDVEFTGWVSYKEIPTLLAQSHCFMLTSRSEGQNDSITEAMTCGLLAVSTDVGLLADLGDEYGIVTPVGDPDAMAEKFLVVLQNPERWKSITARSLAWATEHDLNWTLRQLDARLNELVKLKR